MGDYNEAEWAFQQQLMARMQQQQYEEEDEAERAWQAALAAQSGGGLGSHLLNPKGLGGGAPQFQMPEGAENMSAEEMEEEAERAWREALALQGSDDDPPMDEEAERAWQEALEAQQEALDLQDDAYYEELYRNTRINEGNKVSLEKEIQDLNEQRWKLRDKKAEYYSGMKELMESSKALDVLRNNSMQGGKRPLKGILKKRLERVKIERRLTLRMTRSPFKEGVPRKRVGFILPEDVDASGELLRLKNQEVERLLSSGGGEDNEEKFLEMSLQFIQDFKEEEERLKQESEEIKRMEEQVARLEAELAREGIALAQKYNDTPTPAAAAAPLKPSPRQTPDAAEKDPLADAKNANLPARIKRGTKGFGGIFIDEVQKMLGEEELQKIEARIAGIPQEDAEDAAQEGDDDDDAPDPLADAKNANLPARVKRGTKGFGGVFIEQVHKMLEDDKLAEAAAGATNGTAKPGTAPPASPPPSRHQPAKPGPKPGPHTAKPVPLNNSRQQVERLKKEEEERKAAELAAKKEEEEKKNQERLKQAAEARKILVSPRPATLPSPRGTTAPAPTKIQPTTPQQPQQPQPPARPVPTTTPPKPAPTQQPKPAPGTAKPGPQQPPSRPERSLSDPVAARPSAGGLSTAQRLEAQQGSGISRGSSPVPPLKITPPSASPASPASPATTPTTPTATPPSPQPGGGSGLRKAGDQGAASSSTPSFTPPPRSSKGSVIVRRPGVVPGKAPVPMPATPTNGATPPATTPTTKPAPTAGRGTTTPTSPRTPVVKPLNHPEPVKRGVGRPSALDPTISAKANFFEQKQQQNASAAPAVSEEVIQRRARLDMFKNKILAKNGQDALATKVNS